jgi:hypothetical protein
MAHAAVARPVLGLAAIVGVAVACQPSTDLAREVLILQAATEPPGASLVTTRELTRGPWSVTAQWEVTTDLRWDEYVAGVGKRLLGYARVVDRPGRVEFSRDVSSEGHSLAFESIGAGPPLRVRVTFIVLPD